MCNLSVLASICGNNAGGTKAVMFVIPASEITAEPAFLDTTGPGDTITLAAGYTLVTTVGLGYWRQIAIAQDSGRVESEPVGQVGGMGFKNRAIGTLLGFRGAQKEVIMQLASTGVVAIVPDKNGIYHVIGSKDDPAYLTPGGVGTTGENVESRPEFPFTLEASASHPSPVYNAVTYALDVTPATE